MGKWKKDYNLNRKYIASWEEGREWLTHTEDGRGFCMFCNCSFIAKLNTIQQHEKSKKHLKVMENKGLSVPIKKINLKTDTSIHVSKLENTVEIEDEEVYDEDAYIIPERFSGPETPKKIQISCMDCDTYPNLSEKKEPQFAKRLSIISKRPAESTPKFKFPTESKYIILNNSSSQNLSNISATEGSSGHTETLVESISNTFKEDLRKFLNKNESVRKCIQDNPDFAEGEAGVSRLTRMLVGQMAQQYLMEYTVDSWRSKSHPNKSNLMANKLSEIEKTMEQSVLEVKTIKAQFDAQDLLNQPEILMDGLSSTCQDISSII